MVELFIRGDVMFMSFLSLILLVILLLATQPYHGLLPAKSYNQDAATRRKSMRSLGLFALIFGIFSQLLGLYGALESIREWGIVEAEMLYEGIWVSATTLIYGAIIFVISLLTSMPVPKLSSQAR